MKNIKIAIIGTNFISDKLANAAKETEGVEITAVYSRAMSSGKRFADLHSISKIYCDFNEMLADKEIDAVYVASPTFLHKEHSIAALEAGKHVLCEKSIAIDYGEFLQMKDAALKSGKVFLEAMRPAHDPALDAIIENFKKIGRIRRVHLEFCKYSSRYDNFKNGIVENAFDVKLKNSALSDIGVYPLWLAVRLFGEPQNIIASSVDLNNGFNALGCVIMQYNGFLSNIAYSKITESNQPSFIEGEDGTLFIDKISEPHEISVIMRQNSKEKVYTNNCKNNMVYELAAFRDMINGKKGFLEYLEVTESLIKTMDRIFEAHKS